METGMSNDLQQRLETCWNEHKDSALPEVTYVYRERRLVWSRLQSRTTPYVPLELGVDGGDQYGIVSLENGTVGLVYTPDTYDGVFADYESILTRHMSLDSLDDDEADYVSLLLSKDPTLIDMTIDMVRCDTL